MTSRNLKHLAFVGAAVANTIPLWLSDLPPLTDVPQHAAQAASFLRLLDPASPLNSVLEIHLFTPYLLGYLLIAALAQVLSIVTATKLVLAAAVVAFPLACSFLRRETGGDPDWDWLTLPLAYSFSYKLGFLNFIVGAPLAMLYVAFLLRHLRAGSRATSIGLFVLAILLILSHALLFLFFTLFAMVLIALEGKGRKEFVSKMRPILFTLALTLPLVLELSRRMMGGEGADAATFTWALSIRRPLQLFAIPYLGPDDLWPRHLLQILPALAILSLPLLGGARFRPWRSTAPLVVFCILFMLLPLEYGDAYILFPRFAMFVVPLYLMTLQPPESPAMGDAFARTTSGLVLLAMISLAVSYPLQYAQKYRNFSAHSAPFLQLLKKMDPGKTVLSMPIDQETSPVRYAYLHYPLWYQAIKGGIVNMNFASFPHMLVRFKPGHAPTLQEGFEFRPRFDWQANQGGLYDYFLVLSQAAPSGLFSEACPVRLKAQEGMWWLYERAGEATDANSLCGSEVPVN